MTGLGPGEHTIQLQARTARQAAVVAISPLQVTVKLETQESQLKPVRVNITSQPPLVSAGDVQVTASDDSLDVTSGPRAPITALIR